MSPSELSYWSKDNADKSEFSFMTFRRYGNGSGPLVLPGLEVRFVPSKIDPRSFLLLTFESKLELLNFCNPTDNENICEIISEHAASLSALESPRLSMAFQ